MTSHRPRIVLTRRAAGVAVLAMPMLLRAQVRPGGALRPTPRQTEGPFYPVAMPADADSDLLRAGSLQYTRGQPSWVEGTVSDTAGQPISGAAVEIWQCDEDGNYLHPRGGRFDPAFQGFGRMVVGADGHYRFRTIKPVPYAGRTPHIHVKVKLGTRELLTTQLYVADDPGNSRDGLWRSMDAGARQAVTVPFLATGDGLRATFPIVIAA